MKRVKNLLVGAAGVAVMVAAGASFAAPVQPVSIALTKHNLGTSNTRAGENHMTTGTAEICVFCHTPHASDTSAPAPLWNRALGANTEGVKTGFLTYDALGTSTLDGKIAAGSGSVGSVSLACLSCHDGSMGMDNVINAPGSGWGNGRIGGASAAWTGPSVDSATGKMTTASIAMLGTDLKNDHPVGIQYAGGCASGTYSASSTCVDFNDKDFKALTQVTGKTLWFVDTDPDLTINNPTGRRTAQDMILYSRNITSGGSSLTSGALEPFVECASCHDPHVGSRGDTANPQVAFMRVSQAGSGVCLACHTK